MFVVVDNRQIVVEGYRARLRSEGVSAIGFCPEEFREWLDTVSICDRSAVEAILLGQCDQRHVYARLITGKFSAPLIATDDVQNLTETLELFAAGVDDVVRKPVHVREILARAAAIRRRNQAKEDFATIGDMEIFFDGRDPTVRGETFPLPRRERRILEYLCVNAGRRVTKSQVFNAIYGVLDDNTDEAVVESHISKLRKKLRVKLGNDPIDSKRHLGYCLKSMTGGGGRPPSSDPGVVLMHGSWWHGRNVPAKRSLVA